MFHPLTIFSSLFTKIVFGLIIFGVAGAAALRRSKRIEVQMRRLGEMLNLEFFRSTDKDDGFGELYLVGYINGYSVEVTNMPTSVRSARQHVVIVRIFCNNFTDTNFYLRNQSQLKELFAAPAKGDRILTGDEMFDSTFTLHGNDPHFAVRIFDNTLRTELCNNAESFVNTHSYYTGDRLEFRELGRIVRQAHVDRLAELIPFLVDVTHKIDRVAKKS